MKSSSCYIYLYAFMYALFFVFGGCCTQRMADEIISETPRLVDYVARSDSGATLFEDYKGERMFTYSYLTNNAGIKITSVFCGHPSDCSLVHRRLYQENGKIVRTESITGKDPMVLELEVYDLNTEECVHREWITQGVDRRAYLLWAVRARAVVLHRIVPAINSVSPFSLTGSDPSI